MDKELKEKWLTALESGKYKQAKNALKSEKGFCCLGVLGDVIDPEGWDPCLKTDWYDWRGYSARFLPNSILPKPIQSNLAKINDTSNDFQLSIEYIKEDL